MPTISFGSHMYRILLPMKANTQWSSRILNFIPWPFRTILYGAASTRRNKQLPDNMLFVYTIIAFCMRNLYLVFVSTWYGKLAAQTLLCAKSRFFFFSLHFNEKYHRRVFKIRKFNLSISENGHIAWVDLVHFRKYIYRRFSVMWSAFGNGFSHGNL